MTVFEKIKSMNFDEFVEWFDENCIHDTDPCIKWFDRTYCKKCEGVIENGYEYSYCELSGKCTYFKDMDKIPDNKQTIMLWLNSEF